MTLDITQFYQTFFDEADELLADMEQLLLALDLANPDPEDLRALFRAAHSIKGGAATFGFSALTETTHILESLLDRARNNELVLRRDMIATFLETKDVLSDQLGAYRASAEPDAVAAKAICAKLEYLRDNDPADDVSAIAGTTDMAKPEPERSFADAAALAQDLAQVALALGPNEPPPHVIEQASEAVEEDGEWTEFPATPDASDVADNAAKQDGPHLKITLRGVGEKDQALLTEELGNLGTVVGERKSGEDLTLWLHAEVSSDDIVAVCCFVIDEAQIAVSRGNAADAAPAGASQAAAELEETNEVAAKAPASEKTEPVAAPAATESRAVTEAPEAPKAPEGDKKTRTAAAPAAAEGSSIRVGVEKVDQLINLVGALVITQAMLAETTSTFDPALHDRLFNGMAQLERNARDLQEAVMSIRMMPMDYVFSRFPRLVLDLAAKLGKQVELVTFGQATELDKSLIERIIDPLTHLVRNSLHHGIETVDARRAAGNAAGGERGL